MGAAEKFGGTLKGKHVTIYTDRDPCSYCDLSRGIEAVARHYKAASLTIVGPGGRIRVY